MDSVKQGTMLDKQIEIFFSGPPPCILNRGVIARNRLHQVITQPLSPNFSTRQFHCGNICVTTMSVKNLLFNHLSVEHFDMVSTTTNAHSSLVTSYVLFDDEDKPEHPEER